MYTRINKIDNEETGRVARILALENKWSRIKELISYREEKYVKIIQHINVHPRGINHKNN